MISNITFTGREELLINAAEYAAKNSEKKAQKAIEVVKASTIPSELAHPALDASAKTAQLYQYIGDDAPIQLGKNINQLV